jgi:hypothetical protein
MAEAFKILAQSNPAATTSTNLYTVPGATNTTISSITVCNRSATPTSFRISVAVAGAALADTQYIYFDQAIDGNSTFVATIGITLNATDVVRVFSGAATLTFIAFGVEVS